MPHYAIGLDLGQAADHTALALLEYDSGKQPVYRLRGLHRFPLGTPYTELPRTLEPRLTDKPLVGHVNLAIDATGVGAAVTEHFRDRLPSTPLYAITITGGSAVTGTDHKPNVPKQDLISTTSVILEQRRLHIAANMEEKDTLEDELLAYRRTTTDQGNDTYAAASGSHDDLVLALSLALWTAEHKRPPGASYRSNMKLLSQRRIPTSQDIVDAHHRSLYGW